jgi:uncharacterized membrane-anchored protein
MTQLYITIGFVSGFVFSVTYYFEKKDKVKHIFTHIALIMVLNTFFWLIFLAMQIYNKFSLTNKN